MEKILEYKNFYIDRILDKLSKDGMDSLTSIEKEFLNNYKSMTPEQLDKYEADVKKRESEYGQILEYDPRTETDTTIFDEVGQQFGINISFDDWSDEQIEDGKYNIIWDSMREEDIINFLDEYNLQSVIIEDPWDKLSSDIQDNFKNYCKRFKNN